MNAMNRMRNAILLCVALIVFCPAAALAGSAQVELSIVDEQGQRIEEALVMFARVDDPTQTFTVGQNEAGLYIDALQFPGKEASWRITRVVAAGYMPSKVSVRSSGGEQTVQDLELGPSVSIPEISTVAGGTTKIDLTLGDRKTVMQRHAETRAAAAAEAPESPAAPGVDAAYSEALRLYGAGDVEGALPHFAEAASANPQNLEIHVTYANVLYKAKRYDEFDKVARETLALDPENRELWMMLYSSARTRGDMVAARDALLEVKRHGGSGPDLLQHLDFVARKLGQSPDAIPAWEAILELDPKSADACVALASLYSDRGDLSRSEKYLDRAVKLAPSRAPDLYFDLANKLSASDTAGPGLDRAIELYRKAIELSPQMAPAHKKLGLALWKKQDTAGARAELDRYLELNPQAEDAEQIRDYIERLQE